MRHLLSFPHKHSESPASVPLILGARRATTSEPMLCCKRESPQVDTAGEDNTEHSKQKQKLGVNVALTANCECHCQDL